MTDPFLLGLDLGTTFAKAGVYDLEGRSVAEADAAYPTHRPAPGTAEQSPQDWTLAITQAASEAVRKAGSRRELIAAAGLAAHGPGILLVDESGRSLLPACPTWEDERCRPQGQRILEALGAEWTGQGSAWTNLAARLQWTVETYPEEAERARFALTIKDYVLHWLTGEFATDPTSGPGRSDWLEPYIAQTGWSTARLLPIHPPTSSVAEMHPARCAAFGLAPGVPVVVGSNDGAAAVMACGITRPGPLNVGLGTNGVARAVVSEPPASDLRLDHELFCYPFIEDMWIAGGSLGGGMRELRWLLGLLGANSEEEINLLLNEAAASPPGSRGVRFTSPASWVNPDLPDQSPAEAFSGLSPSTGRGDLIRALLEGVARNVRQVGENIRPQDGDEEIVVSGGGTGIRVWRQILADVLDRRVVRAPGDAALGAAVWAAAGLGVYPDVKTAAEAMCRAAEVIPPNRGAAAAYLEIWGR